MTNRDRPLADYAPLIIRIVLGALFIAHLYWKMFIRPGGLPVWWSDLEHNYTGFVPPYVFSVEVICALTLIPGIFTRYVALYAMPMMAGAAQFWLARKGFFFTGAGAEAPLLWLFLLGLQVMLGDGPFAVLASPDPKCILRRLTGKPAAA